MKPKSTMGNWKKKKISKKTKGSQTTGKQKGINPSQLIKWMCKHNRSWKHPQYALLMCSGEFPRKIKK